MVQVLVTHSATPHDAAELWPVYASVFGDYADHQTWREAVWDKHSVRSGFRLARAWDGDALIGFAYGYTGHDGQWWTDNARKVLGPHVAEVWLGGHFELVSIGVLAAVRRRSVGRSLMRSLLNDLPHERMLLMTSCDSADPARRLYASDGWHVLGSGIGHDTVIMGRRATDDASPA